MLRDQYLTVSEFARRVNISPRNARTALRRGRYRGHSLTVLEQRGRGGRSGMVLLVAESSLPAHLRSTDLEIPERVAPEPPAPPPGRPDPRFEFRRWAVEEIDRRAQALGLTLKAAAADLSAELRDLPAPRHDGPRPGASTLLRWHQKAREGGLGSLVRRARADHGRARVILGSFVDRCFRELCARPFSDAELNALAQKYQGRIYGHLNPGRGQMAVRSRRKVKLIMAAEIFNDLKAAGFPGDIDAVRSKLRLADRFFQGITRHILANTMRTDAAEFASKAVPRSKRIRNFPPRGRLAADVLVHDNLAPRDDGSATSPRSVVFQDLATNELFFYPVLLPKGSGIRQEHVFQALIALMSDPRWGAPQELYIDNGSEFAQMNLVEPIANLARLAASYTGGTETAVYVVDMRTRFPDRAVRFSTPFNPQSKFIEGLFRAMAGQMCQIEGFIGGERMKKPTENLGRSPVVYSGTWPEWCAELRQAVDMYHALPQVGHLAGRSPNQALRNAIADGLVVTPVDSRYLERHFAVPIKHRSKVHRGGILKVDGREWVCGRQDGDDVWNELLSLVGESVQVLASRARSATYYAIDEREQFLGKLHLREAFDAFDPKGAEHQARQRARQRRQLRALSAEATPTTTAERALALTTADPAPTPPVGPPIQFGAGNEQEIAILDGQPDIPDQGPETDIETEIRKNQEAWNSFFAGRERKQARSA